MICLLLIIHNFMCYMIKRKKTSRNRIHTSCLPVIDLCLKPAFSWFLCTKERSFRHSSWPVLLHTPFLLHYFLCTNLSSIPNHILQQPTPTASVLDKEGLVLLSSTDGATSQWKLCPKENQACWFYSVEKLKVYSNSWALAILRWEYSSNFK